MYLLTYRYVILYFETVESQALVIYQIENFCKHVVYRIIITVVVLILAMPRAHLKPVFSAATLVAETWPATCCVRGLRA